MKIAIIGSGAMGSIYGGILSEDGNEVYLIDIFQEHIDRINENGLCIVENGKERWIKNIKATSNAEEVGKVDLAIVFVKSTITDMAVKQNSAVLDENTTVLTLQNGLGNIEKIESQVNLKQIIAGTSTNGGSMIEPGKINHAGNGGTVIGELDGNVGGRIQELKELLDTPKLGAAVISDNIMGVIWKKLIINAGINPLTAMTGLKNGELLDRDESVCLLEGLVDEAIKVAKSKGVRLDTNIADVVKEVCKATNENTSSMLADIQNNRRTEIDNINGKIVEIGRINNIDTPINDIFTNLIHLKQRGF